MIESVLNSGVNFYQSHPRFLLLAAILLGFLSATFYWRLIWWNKRKKIFKKQSSSVIKGQVHEQFAPFLPNFKYRSTEAKFLGKPIDMIIFQGLDEGNVQKIVFLEIKSGRNRQLSPTEKSIRDAVKQGQVIFDTYTWPNDLN